MSEVHRNGEQLLDQIEALLDQEECSKAAALAEGALTDGGLPREIRAELLRKKEIALFRLGRYAEALGILELLRPCMGGTRPWLREMALVLYAMSRENRTPGERTLLLLLAEEAFEGSCQVSEDPPTQTELDFLEEIRWQLYDRQHCGEIPKAVASLPEEERTSRTRQQLALALCEMGEFQQAREVLESAPGERDPRHWYTMGYLLYHQAYQESGQYRPDVSAAREQFLRCLEQDPGPLLSLECRQFLDAIKEGIYLPREAGNDWAARDALRYGLDRWNAVGEHIRTRLGDSDRCFRSRRQTGLELAVPLIPPAEGRKGYLLCTQGLGAVVMDPPGGAAGSGLERVELFLTMIPGWEPVGEDPKKLWPAAALLELAALPLADPKVWIGPGRIFELPNLAVGDCGQCCALILPPSPPFEDADPCTLPDGELVRFCQVVFLYREEAQLLLHQGLPALWEKLGGESCLVDPERENSCKL